MFALPETFHGDHPPHEPKTGIFTGVFPCELQIIKISSVSFRSKRGLLLMFQHEEGRAGIQGEYPVLSSGKTCRFYSPTRDLTGPDIKNQRRQVHAAATPIRNPYFSHTGWAFYEIIRLGTPIVFLVSHSRLVCHDFLPDTPFAITGQKNLPKGTSTVFFYHAVGGNHQSSPRASSISSIA